MSIRRSGLFGAIALVILLAPAFAPAAKALTLVPPSLEFTADPGKKIETKVKLFNEGTEPTSVFGSTSNFTAKGENGDPDFDFATTPTDLASWIDFPVGAITLKAGETVEIPITINVPTNAEPGGHYASIFFGTDPSVAPKNGGQVNVRSLIGTLVILRVEGEIREHASIASFTTKDKKTSYSRLPVEFDLRITNDGNVHVRPQGTIVIKNIFGGETSRLTINDANGAVLPNSTRQFVSNWEKQADASTRGNFFSEIMNEARNFAFGPYTASATVTYGQSKLTLQSSVQLTVIPWRLLTVIVLLLILVITAIVMGMKQYNAAIIRRAQSHNAPPGPKV